MTALSQADQKLQASHRVRAQLLRKVSNSSPLERTMRKAVRVLAEAGIPSLIVGGYAVQEHGYARFTSDVDIVVPDVAAARAVLSINGFRENPGSTMCPTDRVFKVEIDRLPGGGSVGPGPLVLPHPEMATAKPTVVPLARLIEIKLSSFIGSPLSRNQDFSDVLALIKANKLARNLPLDPAVAARYQEAWDGLQMEQSRPELTEVQIEPKGIARRAKP